MPAHVHRSEGEAFYCITWRDSPGQYAWQVDISRQGFTAFRNFSVLRHGGKDAALLAARAWRDAVLKQLPPMTKQQRHTVVRRNSPSGIPGVRRQERNALGNAACWVATLASQGQKTCSARFAVSRFGEEGAKQLAIEARRRFLQEHADRLYALGPVGQVLSVKHFGDAACQPRGDVSLVWDKHAAQHRQLERLQKNSLLPDPPARAAPATLTRRSYASTGPLWEACVRRAEGGRRFQRFLVAVHGEENARRLAEEALAKMRKLYQVG